MWFSTRACTCVSNTLYLCFKYIVSVFLHFRIYMFATNENATVYAELSFFLLFFFIFSFFFFVVVVVDVVVVVVVCLFVINLYSFFFL